MGIRRQCSLVFLAAGIALAEERKAAPVPGGETSIDAARQDFDAVKALRQPGGQPKGDLPRIVLPDLPANEREPTVWRAEKKTKMGELEERKKKNWLVDAMEKSADSNSHKQSKDRNKSEEPNPFLLAIEENRAEGASSIVPPNEPGTERKSEKTEAREPRPAARNPLAGFMAGWMTPQDYALLQPKGETPAAKDALPTTHSGGLTASAGFLGESLGAGAIDGATALTPASGGRRDFTATPKENPYLQTVLPEPSPAVLVQPPAPTVLNPASAPRVQTPPASIPEAPQRSTRPDFAQPRTDDKYFKPLKRF